MTKKTRSALKPRPDGGTTQEPETPKTQATSGITSSVVASAKTPTRLGSEPTKSAEIDTKHMQKNTTTMTKRHANQQPSGTTSRSDRAGITKRPTSREKTRRERPENRLTPSLAPSGPISGVSKRWTPAWVIRDALKLPLDEMFFNIILHLRCNNWCEQAIQSVICTEKLIKRWCQSYQQLFTALGGRVTFEQWHALQRGLSATGQRAEANDYPGLRFWIFDVERHWPRPADKLVVRFWLLGHLWNSLNPKKNNGDTLNDLFVEFGHQNEATRKILSSIFQYPEEQAILSSLPEVLLVKDGIVLPKTFKDGDKRPGLTPFGRYDCEFHVPGESPGKFRRVPTNTIIGVKKGSFGSVDVVGTPSYFEEKIINS